MEVHMLKMSTSGAEGLQAERRLFIVGACAMTGVTVAGFGVQLLTGRSSFDAPLLVHAHAVVFMGWLAIYLAQTALAARGAGDWHRRLGWLAMAWLPLMLLLGVRVVVDMVRRGETPFFFRPLHFLVLDPASLLAFAGLTVWAIAQRRSTDWHARLHFCAMVALLGPGIGRLIPSPALMPWAWEVTIAVSLVFPLAAIFADRLRTGRVHPAWLYGLAALVLMVLVTEVITYGPVGEPLYRMVTAGSAGESVAPLAFPAPPGPPPA
jgi:hypothetical protein